MPVSWRHMAAAGAFAAVLCTSAVPALEKGAGFPLAAMGTLAPRADYFGFDVSALPEADTPDF